MDKINSKLNKYRVKLVNASNPEKMEIYNLKMQQYMILQNRMIKSGGDYSIFAAEDLNKLTEDTKTRMSNNNTVYTVDSVQKFLDKITGDITNASENSNKIINDNQSLSKQIIDTHRAISNQVNLSEFNDYSKITDALNSFQKYENTVVKYYSEELTNILKDSNVNHDKEINIIIYELNLFNPETKQKILEELQKNNLNIPENILQVLQNAEVPQVPEVQQEQVQVPEVQQEQVQVPEVQQVPNEPAFGGKKRKSKKKYMDKLRRAFERENANLNILDE